MFSALAKESEVGWSATSPASGQRVLPKGGLLCKPEFCEPGCDNKSASALWFACECCGEPVNLCVVSSILAFSWRGEDCAGVAMPGVHRRPSFWRCAGVA